MRLRLTRARFVEPVLSSKELVADERTVLELDEETERIYVTRDGRERFTPIANVVEAEFMTHDAPPFAEALPGVGQPYPQAPKPRRARSRRSDSGPATS